MADPADEADEDHALHERMADLLTRTVNAIRGEPPPLTRWSWHDLPERAAAERSARITAQTELEAANRRLSSARLDLMQELHEQGWTPPRAPVAYDGPFTD